MKRLAGTVLLGLALAACGGGDDNASTNTASASTTGSGSGGSGGSGGSSSSTGSAGAGGGPVEPCTAGNICLDVKPIMAGSVAAGRLAVMWYQPDIQAPTPTPYIPYDVDFDPTVTRVTIPIADIPIPSEPLLVCERMCGDEYMCPCLSDPKVGYGVVLVTDDTNQNMKVDPGEATGYYGLGWILLGYSAMAFMPAPAPFDANFVDGIEQGVRPYKVLPGSGGYNTLGHAQDTDVFDLNMCPGPATACSPPLPNLH